MTHIEDTSPCEPFAREPPLKRVQHTRERAMKKIEAVIRHYKLEDTKNALSQAGIQG